MKKIEELFELTLYSNDLLVDVFNIVNNNNNPKMAVRKLNKDNYNNKNLKYVQELPFKLSTINDELIIKLMDNV